MKEVFRNFEGKLNVDQQKGYIIYELSEFYIIQFLNVYSDVNDSSWRIKKELLSEADFGNLDKIYEILVDSGIWVKSMRFWLNRTDEI